MDEKHCYDCRNNQTARRAAEAERDFYKEPLKAAEILVLGWKTKAAAAEAEMHRHRVTLQETCANLEWVVEVVGRTVNNGHHGSEAHWAMFTADVEEMAQNARREIGWKASD